MDNERAMNNRLNTAQIAAVLLIVVNQFPFYSRGVTLEDAPGIDGADAVGPYRARRTSKGRNRSRDRDSEAEQAAAATP